MTEQTMTLHDKECKRYYQRKSRPAQNQEKPPQKSQTIQKGLEEDRWISCDIPCKTISNRKRQLSLYQYQAKKWDSPAKKEMEDLWRELKDMEVKGRSPKSRGVSRQKRRGGRNNRFDENRSPKNWAHKSRYSDDWNQDLQRRSDGNREGQTEEGCMKESRNKDVLNRAFQNKTTWNRISRNHGDWNKTDRNENSRSKNDWNKQYSSRENQSHCSTSHKPRYNSQRPRRQVEQRSSSSNGFEQRVQPKPRTFTVRGPGSQETHPQANGFLLTEALLALLICMITGFLLLSSAGALAKSQTLEISQDMVQTQESAG